MCHITWISFRAMHIGCHDKSYHIRFDNILLAQRRKKNLFVPFSCCSNVKCNLWIYFWFTFHICRYEEYSWDFFIKCTLARDDQFHRSNHVQLITMQTSNESNRRSRSRIISIAQKDKTISHKLHKCGHGKRSCLPRFISYDTVNRHRYN